MLLNALWQQFQDTLFFKGDHNNLKQIYLVCLALWSDKLLIIFKLFLKYFLKKKRKEKAWGFLGGAVVKSLPANTGDMGSSPGPGGSCMPRSNWARAPQLLSLRSGACKPQRLKPVHPRAHAPRQEKPPQWEARALQQRVAPTHHN